MAMRRRIKVGVNLSAAKRKPKSEPDNITPKERNSVPLSQIKAEVPQTESTTKEQETQQTKLKTEPPTVAFKCPPRVDFNRSNSNTTTNNDELNQLENDGAQVMQMDLQRTAASSFQMSPSKSQRQRIRPTPIFGQRRNSLVGLPPSPLSLSSEDANEMAASPQKRERHYSGSQNCVPTSSSSTVKASCYGTGRIRTESTCSVFSDSHTSTTTKSRKHDDHITQRTQSRRDFESRFSNGIPDKSNLKMFDLIYYNPATNPMEQKSKIEEVIKKERKDEVPDEDEEFLDNDASAVPVPVPQLKLNSKGELILDDKSLEIETTAEQEARKVLAKSSLIYLDENTGMNGFYKRQKRTRDWAPEDTIRFYRCLQTIGTDFSMMCQLFPKRTRRDIKLKFKKEERCNGALINKALLHPNLFNIQELKDQFEFEDRQREEEEQKQQANKQIQYKKVKIKTSKSARALKNADDIYNQELREMEVKKPRKQRKVKSSNKNETVEIETNKKPKKKRQTKKSKEEEHITIKNTSLDEEAAINLLLKDEEEFLAEVKNSAPLQTDNRPTIQNQESYYTPDKESMPADNDCIEFLANDATGYDASQHFDYMSDSDASQNDNEFRVGTPDANSRTLVNMDNGNFTLVKDFQTINEQQYVRLINNEEIMDARFRLLSSNMSVEDEQNSLFGLVECDTYVGGKYTPKTENFVSLEEPKSSTKILPETKFSDTIDHISSTCALKHCSPKTENISTRDLENSNVILPPTQSSDTLDEQEPIRSPDDSLIINDEAEIQKILENIANGSLVVVSTFNPDSPDEHSNEIYMLDPTTGELCEEPLDLPSELIQSILSVMT